MLCNYCGAEAAASPKMPDYLGADQRKTREEEKEDKPIRGQWTEAGVPGGRVRTRLGPGGEARRDSCRALGPRSFCAAGDWIWGRSRLSPPALSVSFTRSKFFCISRWPTLLLRFSSQVVKKSGSLPGLAGRGKLPRPVVLVTWIPLSAPAPPFLPRARVLGSGSDSLELLWAGRGRPAPGFCSLWPEFRLGKNSEPRLAL